MDWFKSIYTLLGGLGLFFFGIMQLSEGLQSVASDLMKKVISWLTTNRFIAVLVGLIITMIIQSSSVTTVMVVSFVNAGLMSLTQAIGVIFGSNIGTTITGWIVAINIGKYGLALIGAGMFPMLYSKGNLRHLGRLLFALGLIFFGLELMSLAFKPLRDNNDFRTVLSYFSAETTLSLVGCILVGTIFTAILQSSSAMLGVTLAMAMTGTITFQTSVAIVIGQNIGTTITAYLASVNGTTNAKRAARAHIIFNIVGALLFIFLFRPFVNLTQWLIAGDADFINESGNKPYIATHIAAAHTIFNISTTLIFLPFLQQLARLVTFLTPSKDFKEPHKLSILGSTNEISPTLALEEANLEIIKMAAMVRTTILDTREYLLSEIPVKDKAKKIKKYETITDNIQKEMYLFLNKVMRRNLSGEQTKRASGLIRASDELESIADYCEALVNYRNRLAEKETYLSKNKQLLMASFFDDTINFFDNTVSILKTPEKFDNAAHIRTYVELNKHANEIRETHLKTIEEGVDPLNALTFSDIIVALRRIKNHSLNLAEALKGGKTKH